MKKKYISVRDLPGKKKVLTIDVTAEFCPDTSPGNPGIVTYGKIIKVNNDTKDFDFMSLDNGIYQEETGKIYTNIGINRIRGITSYDIDYEKTFNIEPKKKRNIIKKSIEEMLTEADLKIYYVADATYPIMGTIKVAFETINEEEIQDFERIYGAVVDNLEPMLLTKDEYLYIQHKGGLLL